MNLNAFNEKVFFTDEMTIWREGETLQADGSTKFERASVADLTNVPCKMSKDKDDEPDQSDDINTVNAKYVVFAAPEFDIRAGDKLIVTHSESTYELIAGLPHKYKYHQEIPAVLKEFA